LGKIKDENNVACFWIDASTDEIRRIPKVFVKDGMNPLLIGVLSFFWLL
jgi:hypothetical protein